MDTIKGFPNGRPGKRFPVRLQCVNKEPALSNNPSLPPGHFFLNEPNQWKQIEEEL